MKTNLWILASLILSLLTSCGEKGVKEDVPLLGNPNLYRWTEAMRPAQDYDDGELAVAKNVCIAFQKKRAFLASLSQDLIMDFNFKNQTCGRSNDLEQEVTARMTIDRTGQLKLVNRSRSVRLLEDVLTDVHPRLKPFCDEVLAGKRPSNTMRDGLLQFQVNFFQGSGFEWVQVVEFREEGTSYVPYLFERAAVITDYNTEFPQNTHGFVKVRALNRPCPDQQNTRSQIQEWL